MFEQITIKDIDQEWAWSQLVGRMISVGKRYKYCSPLRNDNKPGVWFEYHNEILLIVDFGDKPNSHINCVTAWSRIKGIHWRKALREIYEKQGVRVKREVKEKVKKVEKIITFIETWSDKHQDYWNKREGVPDFVKGVGSYTIHGDRTRTWIVDELCFSYVYSSSKCKLYFPERKKDEQRFISNLKPEDVFFNFVDETLLISKAAKDYWELLKVWEHSLTHVQCENCWHDMVDKWKVFESKWVFMDGDRAGIKNGYELSKEINAYMIFIPTVDSLNIASKMPEDFKELLPNNLRELLNQFTCTDCPDTLRVADYSLFELTSMKDYDDLVTRNLNEKEIFKWIIS